MPPESLLNFSAISVALCTSGFWLYSQSTFPQKPTVAMAAPDLLSSPHNAQKTENGGNLIIPYRSPKIHFAWISLSQVSIFQPIMGPREQDTLIGLCLDS